MQTLHVPNAPSLDVSATVFRTRNSVYAMTLTGDQPRLVCLFGTFAGESFTFDLQASTVLHMGERMVFHGLVGGQPHQHDGVLVTTEVIDISHA